MTKYLLTFAALLSFSVLPTVAQEESDSENSSSLSPEEAKEAAKATKKAKKAAADRKKQASLKKKRDNMKFKWMGSLKAALAAAKKANTTCVVLYSDPSFCHYCVKLDNEIFESREFKKAKGIGVGYRSTSPIKEYNLSNGMPSGVIVGPDGKVITTFGYNSGMTPESYVKKLQDAQPAWPDLGGDDEEDED